MKGTNSHPPGEELQTSEPDQEELEWVSKSQLKRDSKALQDLARRTEVPEIENFVATIVQADQLGVSIAKVLRTHAEQMRIFRRAFKNWSDALQLDVADLELARSTVEIR